LLSFFISSLFVAERACLSQLTGDGRGEGEEQNKTTAKSSGPLSYLYIPFTFILFANNSDENNMGEVLPIIQWREKALKIIIMKKYEGTS
jgi:hypothetical protein